LEEARGLASAGSVISATLIFEDVIILDPSLDIEPEKEAIKLAVSSLIEQGYQLARNNHIDDAIAKFEQAVELDETQDLTLLIAEAKRLAVKALIEQGRQLIADRDIDNAIVKFEQAVELDDTQDLDSLVAEAKAFAAHTLVEQGRKLARERDHVGALAKFEEAVAVDETLVDRLTAESLVFLGRLLARRGYVDDELDQLKAKIDSISEMAERFESMAMRFELCRLREFESLAQTVADSCEQVNQQTPLLMAGVPVKGTIFGPSGDLWAVDVPTRSQIAIRLRQDSGSNLDPYLSLYDPNLQLRAEHNDTWIGTIVDLDAELNLTLTEPGRYFIQASRCCPNDDGYTTGDYVLGVTVTEMEEPVAATATPTPIAPSPLAVPTPHVMSPLATPTPHVVSPLVGAGLE